MTQGERGLRAVGRGVALALAGVALWGIGLTVDLSPQSWSGERGVALLAHQLRRPVPGPLEEELGPLGRLLVEVAPLLDARDGVALLRQQRQQSEEEEEEELLSREEDVEQPDLQPPVHEEGVLEMTAKGKDGASYLSREGVYLYNRTEQKLDPSVLAGKPSLTLGEGPQILIYHTHGSEAYLQNDGLTYVESDPYRTTDCTRNVVRVGDEMARVFRSYGLQVVHDTELYDYPAYSGAYDRSGAGVERWLEEYPTIRVAIDIHRDALVGSDGSIYKLISTENGERCAQTMLVIGAGHEDWQTNLDLAGAIQRELLADYVTLARPMVLRTGKYNQHRLPGSLLVEVGGHGNTLTEALAGGRAFAHSAAQVLVGMRDQG